MSDYTWKERVGLQLKDVLVNQYLIRFLRVDGTIIELPSSLYPTLVKAGPECWERIFIDWAGVTWTEVPIRGDIYGICDCHWDENLIPKITATTQERLTELIDLAREAESLDPTIKVKDFSERSHRREILVGIRVNEFVTRFDYSDGSMIEHPTDYWPSLKAAPQEWSNYILMFGGYGIEFPNIKVVNEIGGVNEIGEVDKTKTEFEESAFHFTLDCADNGYPESSELSFSPRRRRKLLALALAREAGQELKDYTDPLLKRLKKVLIDGNEVWRSSDSYEISLIGNETSMKSIRDGVLVKKGDRSVKIYRDSGKGYSWTYANRGFKNWELDRISEILRLNKKLLRGDD